jgi:transcriptional regulator with XRE-family HTH domain
MKRRKTIDPVDVLVGQCIRMHRLARKMSQSALGEQLGLTFQQVQKYEKGANRVGAGRLTRIADILGIQVQSLFGDAAAGGQRSGAELSPLDYLNEPGALRLVQAYQRVREPRLRRALVELIEQIAPKA